MPDVADQRIDIDVFDGLTVSLVFPVHAAAARGLSDIGPVGGSVASSAKAVRVHQRFQQQRARAVSGVPVVRYLPGAEGQDLARQSLDADPGQNQEGVRMSPSLFAAILSGMGTGSDRV